MARGDLSSARSKSLLTTDQFRSGVENLENLDKQIWSHGELVTSTGLILETEDMTSGEVWGDKHDKLDKLNEQVILTLKYRPARTTYKAPSRILLRIILITIVFRYLAVPK